MGKLNNIVPWIQQKLLEIQEMDLTFNTESMHFEHEEDFILKHIYHLESRWL